MAFTCTTDGYVHGAVNQAAHTELVNLQGEYFDNTDAGDIYYELFRWGIGAYTFSGPYNLITGRTGYPDTSGYDAYDYTPGAAMGGGYSVQAQLEADRTHQFKARTEAYFGDVLNTARNGARVNFKTNAVTAVANAPTVSGITSATADIACGYYPNTYESTCTVQLQYKRAVDPGWSDAGAAGAGITGYTLHNIARSLAGLLASTLYDVRLVITRTTNNATVCTSATTQFTTLGAAATITTSPATALTGISATLNGIVNPNGVATTYWFDYGLTPAYGTSTAAQGPNSGVVPVPYSQAIGGLTANRIYHFRAHALQGGVDYYGDDLTFSTDTQGHIMPTVYQHFAKYGAATDFYFCVETPSLTGSDRFLNAAVPWVAGDAKVDKDGAGLNDVAALPTRVGATPLYKWAATAGELTANKVNMLLVDADGPAWRDLHMAIETRLLLGQIDVDATAIGGNVHAMALVGVGTGYGLFAKGSTGIRAEAQGTSGHGAYLKGVGGGYGLSTFGGGGVGTTLANNLLDQWEGPEPTTPPDSSDTLRQILQRLKRRFTNKITQDSTKQKWYGDNSLTIVTQRDVSDDLVTQVQGKLF